MRHVSCANVSGIPRSIFIFGSTPPGVPASNPHRICSARDTGHFHFFHPGIFIPLVLALDPLFLGCLVLGLLSLFLRCTSFSSFLKGRNEFWRPYMSENIFYLGSYLYIAFEGFASCHLIFSDVIEKSDAILIPELVLCMFFSLRVFHMLFHGCSKSWLSSSFTALGTWEPFSLEMYVLQASKKFSYYFFDHFLLSIFSVLFFWDDRSLNIAPQYELLILFSCFCFLVNHCF